MTTSKPTLDYFLYSYPEDDLQSKLPSRKEYNELQVYKKDIKDPITGNFIQQTFAHRFMLNYDRLLLLWEAGAGKTWAGLGAAEQFRHISLQYTTKYQRYIDLYFEKAHYYVKRTYVLVKNKNLIELFKQTLYQRTELKTNKEIKKYYKIMTYTDFYNRIQNMNKKEMINRFENTFIIIDEAHNLKPSAGGIEAESNKGLTYRKRYNKYLEFFENVTNLKLILMTATPMIDNIREASYVFNLILAGKSKVNMPTRASSYYNTRKNAILSSEIKMGTQELKKWFKNIISYVGVPDIGIELVYEGRNIMFQYEGEVDLNDLYLKDRTEVKTEEDIIEIKEEEEEVEEEIIEETPSQPLYVIELATIVKRAYMSGIQESIYEKEYLPEELTEAELLAGINLEELTPEETKTKKRKKSFFTKVAKIINFVFPDGSYGNGGLLNNKNLIERYKNNQKLKGDQIDYDELAFTPEFEHNYVRLEGENGIELLDNDLSAKFNTILKIIEQNDSQQVPGIIYIFFPRLKKYGAMILEALVRLIFNYSRYGGEKLQKKKKRLILISGETKNTQKLLNFINESKNYKGEYIRLVITTSAIGEGYSIKNVTTIIPAEPSWNVSTNYQAIRRGYRAGGFDSRLLSEYKDLKVKVYRIAAAIKIEYEEAEEEEAEEEEVEEGEVEEQEVEEQEIEEEEVEEEILEENIIEENPTEEAELIDSSSFEIDLYFLAEKKDWYIKRLKRYMKEFAVDCHLNRHRNILDPKYDYTAQCDYDVCDYKCLKNKSKELEYNTYSLLYADLYIDLIKKELIQQIKIKQILSISEFINSLSKLKLKAEIIIEALERILASKPKVTDIYGFSKYVYHDQNYLYLSDQMASISNNYNNASNNTNIRIQYQNNLKNILENEIKTIITARTLNIKADEFEDFFYNSTITTRAILLQNYIKEPIDTVINALIKKYMRGYYIEINEPITLISNMRTALEEMGKQGREPTDLRKVNFQKWKQIKHKSKNGEIGSKIYIHYVFMFNEAKASQTSGLERFKGNLRIFRPENREFVIEKNESSWEIANKYEEAVYARIIDDTLAKTREKFIQARRGHFLLKEYSKTKTKYTTLEPIYIIHYNINKENLIIIPSWTTNKIDTPAYPTAITEDNIYVLTEKKLVNRNSTTGRLWNRNKPSSFYTRFYKNKLINQESKESFITTKITSEGKSKSIYFESEATTSGFINRDQIKTTRKYYIQGKNGNPYICLVRKENISIYTYQNQIEKQNGLYTKLIKQIDQFEGYWSAYDNTIYQYNGNSILVKIKALEYLLISYEIYSFKAKQKIIDFVSPIGVEYDPFLDKRKISRGTNFKGLIKTKLKPLLNYFGSSKILFDVKQLQNELYRLMEKRNLILYI